MYHVCLALATPCSLLSLWHAMCTARIATVNCSSVSNGTQTSHGHFAPHCLSCIIALRWAAYYYFFSYVSIGRFKMEAIGDLSATWNKQWSEWIKASGNKETEQSREISNPILFLWCIFCKLSFVHSQLHGLLVCFKFNSHHQAIY